MMKNCFCGMVDRRKVFTPYFQSEPLSEILTILNLRHAANRVWTCAESEFRLCCMKLCSSDNHYTTAPPDFKPGWKKNCSHVRIIHKNTQSEISIWSKRMTCKHSRVRFHFKWLNGFPKRPKWTHASVNFTQVWK